MLKQQQQEHQIPKIPECIWIRFVLDVTKAIGVSSHVAHPNIKSRVSQKEGKTFIGQIGDPVRWSTQQAMLEEHHFLLWTAMYVTWVLHSPCRYSLNVEKITIFCLNCVLLCWVSMITNNLGLQKEFAHSEWTRTWGEEYFSAALPIVDFALETLAFGTLALMFFRLCNYLRN